MNKLDRLGWAAGISLAAYGVRVGVRVSDAESLGRVTECLPPAWRPAPTETVERLYSLIAGGRSLRPSVRRYNLLYANAERIARTLELDEAMERLESDLQLYVAEAARQRLFVHAGVVSFNNQAVVIPGRSFSGKTTLVRELITAGAIYYSDEYALIDARGRVHPYPKPLSLRGKPGEKTERRSIEELGATAGIKPLPVAMVVVSRYKAGARWRPRLLSGGRGVLEILANTVSARRNPARALATLNRAVSGARIFKGARGEASETADFILERLSIDYANN